MLYLDDEKAVKSDAFSTAVHFWFDTVLFILLASVFYFFMNTYMVFCRIKQRLLCKWYVRKERKVLNPSVVSEDQKTINWKTKKKKITTLNDKSG